MHGNQRFDFDSIKSNKPTITYTTLSRTHSANQFSPPRQFLFLSTLSFTIFLLSLASMDAANIIVFENSKGDDGTRQLNRTVQKLRLLHPITPA